MTLLRRFTFFWLFATPFIVNVQAEKMRPEHIEQQKNITSKQESKTGCMCPAVIEDGYINWYCGKELKTNGTSGAKCNRDGKYRCVVPSIEACLLYTSPSPRDRTRSRMPSSA